MQTRIVVNSRSSGTQRRLHQLAGALERHGIAAAPPVIVDDHAGLRKAVRRLVDDGAGAILVGGGDGSMTVAAGALAHHTTILGVIPFGTGNSFAQTLGIGTTLDAALAVIAAGHVASVDLGIVNGRYFANFATIGLSAEIAAAAPHALKPLIGPLAYVVGGIGPFLRARGFRATVRWPDGELRLRTAQMVVASGRFFGRQPVLPDASITDGEFAFFTAGGVSQIDLARTYVAFALGRQTALRDAHGFAARKFRVKTKPKAPISIDGDPAGMTPAKFRIAPRALRVFVPAGFTGAPA